MRTFSFSLILTLFILSLSRLSLSQNDLLDSLQNELQQADSDTLRIQLLNDLCWEYAFEDPFKSIGYGTKALDLSEKNKYWTGAFLAKRYMARTYHLNFEFETALELLYSATEIGSRTQVEKRDMALAYNDIGTILEEQNNFVEALKNYELALSFAEKEESKYLAAIVRINICYALHDIEDFQKIIETANEATSVFIQEGDYYSLGLIYNIYGDAYAALGDYDKALKFQLEALEIFREFEAFERISEVYNSIGVIYTLTEDWEKSLYYYNASLQIDDSLESTENIAISYANIAGVYNEIGEMDTALYLFQTSIELANEHGQLKNMMATYKYTSETFEAMGDYEAAYKYRMLYESIKDSIFSIEKRKEIIRIQEEYETEKRKETIALLEAENASVISEARLNYALLFGGLIILLCLIGVVLLYLKTVRSKEAKSRAELEKSLVSLKSTALMAQLNPHLVFNILNSIQGLVANEQIEMANSYISKFSRFMRKTLQLSQMFKITIAEELMITQQYFELEKLRFGERLNLKIENQLSSNNLEIPPLIMQPLIENAIKHGILPADKHGEICLRLYEDDRCYYLEVIDNGLGFSEHTKFNDGIRISQERLRTLNQNNTLIIANQVSPTIMRITVLK